MLCEEKTKLISSFLKDNKCKDVVSIDVRETTCDWTDFIVIGTVTSLGHLRGTASELWGFLSDNEIHVNNRHKNVKEDGWTLIDCDDVVIHLMSEEMRQYYSIENLWEKPSR